MTPRQPLPAPQVWDAVLPTRRQAFPVELNAAARALGARDVLYRAQAQGYTRWLDTGPTIMLALTRSDGRRRATLAHECAHLLLDPLTGAEPFQQINPISQALWQNRVYDALGAPLATQLRSVAAEVGLERACDLLSHELLMPLTWARSIRRCWGGDVASLRDLATSHRLSLSMTMIRLNEVGPAHMMLTLKLTPRGHWLAVRTVGAPRWLNAARVHCTFEHTDTVAFPGERQIDVVIETAQQSRRVRASVTCAGTTRILLIDRRGLKPAPADISTCTTLPDLGQLTLENLPASHAPLHPPT